MHFFSAGFLKSNSIGFNGCVPSAFAYFRLRIEVERLTFSCKRRVPSVFTYFRLLRDERLARSFSFRLLPTPKS